MNRKILSCLIILVLIFITALRVYSAPMYIYPQKYIITIKNAKINKIKKIEVIYWPNIGFNYESNEAFRSWIKNTDFGKKYKNFKDSEIIPKLSEKEIDEIALSYIHKNASEINGYWIEQSIIDKNVSIAKFAVYENPYIKYFPNKIVISYSGRKKPLIYPDGLYLRLVLKDNTILYSAPVYSSKYKIIDEYSKPDEVKKALSVKNQNANFEVDFLHIKNKFEVKEI